MDPKNPDISLEQEGADWRELWRRLGVTGTGAAKWAGLSPYKTPLEYYEWLIADPDYTEEDPDDIPDHIRIGMEVEIKVRDMWNARHEGSGWSWVPACVENTQIRLGDKGTGILAASIDMLNVEPMLTHRADIDPREVKSAKKEDFEYALSTGLVKDESYLWQLHLIRMVTGAPRVTQIPFHVKSNRFTDIYIEQDSALEDRILAACHACWNAVESRTPPEDFSDLTNYDDVVAAEKEYKKAYIALMKAQSKADAAKAALEAAIPDGSGLTKMMTGKLFRRNYNYKSGTMNWKKLAQWLLRETDGKGVETLPNEDRLKQQYSQFRKPGEYGHAWSPTGDWAAREKKKLAKK